MSGGTARWALAMATAMATAAMSAATAQAVPVALSADGEAPRIAVDEAGTGHVVWQEATADGGEATKYCRLPLGATACASTATFQEIAGTKRGASFPPSHVLAAGGGRIVVLVHMCCDSRYGPPGSGTTDGLYAFVSDDGGLTFGPERLIGTADPTGDAVALNRDTVAVVTDATTGGTWVQVAPLAGYTTAAAKVGEGTQAYGGDLAVSGTALYVIFNDLATTFFRAWAAGDGNDVANWSAAAPVGPTTKAMLAGSPTGVHVMQTIGSNLQVHPLTPTGFTPDPVARPAQGTIGDFFADPSGRLHTVWRTSADEWYYRRSADASSWSPFGVLEQTISILPPDAHADADAEGRGWTVTGPRTIVAAPLPPVPRPPRQRVCRRGVCLVARDPIAADGCLDGDGSWRFEVRNASPAGPRVRRIRWWTNPADVRRDGTRPFRFRVDGAGLPPGRARLRTRAHRADGSVVPINLGFQRCPS